MTELKDMTFSELVKVHQGNVLLSIVDNDFKGAVYMAMNAAITWRIEQDKKQKVEMELLKIKNKISTGPR